MKYLLLGGKGLVLSRFAQMYPEQIFPVRDYPEVDITNYDSLASYLEDGKEEKVVVLGAAYTDVDKAQKELGDRNGVVYRTNVVGAKNVAQLCRKLGFFLIYLSTEFVFVGDDKNKGPFSEDRRPVLVKDKMGWYAQTKLLGERAVKSEGGRYAIVRISYPFRAFYPVKLDFARKILFLYRQNKLYPLLEDQFITTTFIDEFCYALSAIGSGRIEGIFHCSSANITTPYKFGKYLLTKATGKDVKLAKISFKEFQKNNPERAPRPQFGGLNVLKTQKILGFKFLTWQEQIDELIAQLDL